MANYDKISEEIRKKLGEELTAAPLDVVYSEAYQQFKKEQVRGTQNLYEKACKFSEKVLKVTPTQADIDKVESYINLTHLDITPKSVYSFTYLSTLALVLFLAIIGLLAGSILIIFVGLLASLSLLLILPGIPKKIFNNWRSRASDQLVLAVLYMIIYMRHTPNLEKSIEFVAKHMPPPISLDFMKVLWDVETKAYASIKESLDNYTKTWKDKNDEFVESVQLIQSSLLEADREQRKQTLDKAVEVILEGTTDHMTSYAHNLQSPIQTLHMLGIVLPVMGLVMLPMVTAFLGASVPFRYLILLYNVILPIMVYFVGAQVLANRPAGSATQDINIFKQAKETKLFGLNVKLSARAISVIIFFVLGLPAFLYFANTALLTNQEFVQTIFSRTAILFSIELIAAIGLSLAAYYHYTIAPVIKLKRSVEKMEREFTTATFQLGNRLQENIPAELVFSKVADAMKGTEIEEFFRIVDYNMVRLGASLRDAIYNEKYGAIIKYPSSLIKNTMSVLTEGIKKGPDIAGRSMITVSQYLSSLHKVDERLKDLLADTTSSMSMQVKLFVPLISGIVVGLAALTTNILSQLAQQIVGLEGVGGAEVAAPGAGLLQVFQIESMLPTPVFQLIVGIYLVEIVIILSFLLAGIIYGHDKIEEKYLIGQNLFMSVLFYIIITSIAVLLFGALAAPITTIQFG